MIRKNIKYTNNRWVHLVILVSLLLLTYLAKAAGPEVFEKQKLKELIDLRKKNFSEYFNSIEQKSGIFGNKTKKDLRSSNEILTSIVRTDNQIIDVLNRSLEYKTFEKTGYNYDKLESEARISELFKSNDTLYQQNKYLKSEIITGKKNKLVLNWLIFLLSTLLLVQYLYFRRKIKLIRS